MREYQEGQTCEFCNKIVTKEFITRYLAHKKIIAHCFNQLFSELTKGDPTIENA